MTQEPELLPPQLEPRRRLVISSGIVAMGLVLAAVVNVLGGAGAGDATFHAVPASWAIGPAQGALVPIDASNPAALSSAIRALRLDAEGKRGVRAEVAAGRMRLGALTVWDSKDEDGDEVTITSARFSQPVPIWNAPTVVVIPYRGPGAMIAVTGFKDGEGGITVGVSVNGQPTNLPPLYVGETVQVTIP